MKSVSENKIFFNKIEPEYCLKKAVKPFVWLCILNDANALVFQIINYLTTLQQMLLSTSPAGSLLVLSGDCVLIK